MRQSLFFCARRRRRRRPPSCRRRARACLSGVRPAGAFFSSKLRRNESPSWVTVSALPARRVDDHVEVAEEALQVEERRDRSPTAWCRALATIIVAAPQLGWQPQLSWPKSASGPFMWSARAAKRRGRPERVPVAVGVDPAVVVAGEVVGEVRGRVALAQARLVAHLLVAAGEGDGLEGGPAHLVVVRRGRSRRSGRPGGC